MPQVELDKLPTTPVRIPLMDINRPASGKLGEITAHLVELCVGSYTLHLTRTPEDLKEIKDNATDKRHLILDLEQRRGQSPRLLSYTSNRFGEDERISWMLSARMAFGIKNVSPEIALALNNNKTLGPCK